MIEAFADEERVEAFGQTLILKLNFGVITAIEGALNNARMPTVAAYIRNGLAPLTFTVETVWAMLREHQPEITRDQVMTIVTDKGAEGAKVGFALDVLLERTWPMAVEGRERKNPPKQRGRSRTSESVG